MTHDAIETFISRGIVSIGLAAVILLFVPFGGQAQVELTEAWRVDEALDMPESVAYDADRGVLYVTNIVGDPSEKDGEGYLTGVSMEGEVIAEQWVSGLNAPKGIAVHDGRVFVADIDALIEIDASNGTIVERYEAPDAGFLNDVAIDAQGRVYVSDSNTDAIYRLSEGEFSIWLEGPEIAAPNGLYAEEDYLIVAACTFAGDDKGSRRHFQYISYEDQTIEIPQGNSPMGNIDGIKPDGSRGYFFTEWGPGTLSHYSPAAGVDMLRELGQGAADLEYLIDDRMMFVPVMMSHSLMAFRVDP
jgi:sugar lactone lactonase YvrE